MKRLQFKLLLFILVLNACSDSGVDSKNTPTENLLIGLITEPVPTATATPHNSPKIGDGGFLFGDPCGPPCFLGIVPGRTTIAEAMEILDENGLGETCEEFDNQEEGAGRGLICESFMLIFDDNSDLVTVIGFEPSIPVRISDVLQKYGSPSFVSVFPEGLPEEPPQVSMVIYYEEDAFCGGLNLPVQDGLTYKLEDSTLITNIGYSLKSDCDYLYTSRSQKWNGYVGYDAGPP